MNLLRSQASAKPFKLLNPVAPAIAPDWNPQDVTEQPELPLVPPHSVPKSPMLLLDTPMPSSSRRDVPSSSIPDAKDSRTLTMNVRSSP